MSSRPARTLRRLRDSAGLRLTLWYAAFFTGGCVLVFGVAYFLLSSSLVRRDRSAIQSKFWDLAGDYQDYGLEGLERAVAVQQHQRKTLPFFIQYAAPGGAEPVRSLRGEWQEYELADLAAAPPDKVEHWRSFKSREDGSALEVLSMRLSDGLLLQVGQTTDDRDESLTRYRRIVTRSMVFVFLISLPGGYVLAWRALRPVRDLIATIKRVQAGAVGERVPMRPGGDEFDELARHFNGMLGRVETLIAGMKSSLDNVAHDLRTPLTRLRAGAEEALASEADLAASRDALADCVEESDRVVGMIETLMDISEAETGIMKLKLEPVDLAAVVEEALEVYRYAAEDKGVELGAARGGPVLVSADKNRMRQVVANLLDNAVKYTPRGGKILLRAARAGSAATVTVSDTGPGIPAQETGKVWDRLYRGDASRSQRGLGLGLSLVKAVVAAHGGTVSIETAPSGGAVFVFSLPAGLPSGGGKIAAL